MVSPAAVSSGGQLLQFVFDLRKTWIGHRGAISEHEGWDSLVSTIDRFDVVGCARGFFDIDFRVRDVGGVELGCEAAAVAAP